MIIFIDRREREEHGIDIQNAAEDIANRDGCSHAHADGAAVEHGFQHVFGEDERRVVMGYSIGRRAAGLAFDADARSVWRVGLKKCRKKRYDAVGVLARHQATGNLGRGFRWNDGLFAGSRITADNAIIFERGSYPIALQQRVARLACTC